MNRNTGPNDYEQVAQHWLTQHHHALAHALNELLDTEAGLREILLHSQHETATDNLGTVLDTEAGLAAILLTAQTPPVGAHDTAHDHTATMELLHALNPADRMALRNNPGVRAANQARARYLERAAVVGLSLDDDRDLAHACIIDLIGDLINALRLGPVRDLALDLDFNLAVDLDRVLVLVRAIDGDRSLKRSRDRARELSRELTDIHAHAVAHDLARDLTLALGLARDRARDLTLVLARACDPGTDLDRPDTFARDLSNIHELIADVRTAEVGRAVGLALRREPFALDKDSLHALLDDFTATDLSNADLTDIDLSGVHWSEHTTHWPSAVDIEDLKTCSDETAPGSGTWIVRSGTATIRDLAER